MTSQEQLKQYSRQAYWDDRYVRGDEHEWSSLEYQDLQEAFEKILPPAAAQPQVLHLGCGTSVGELDQLNSVYDCVCMVESPRHYIRLFSAQHHGLEVQDGSKGPAMINSMIYIEMHLLSCSLTSLHRH